MESYDCYVTSKEDVRHIPSDVDSQGLFCYDGEVFEVLNTQILKEDDADT